MKRTIVLVAVLLACFLSRQALGAELKATFVAKESEGLGIPHLVRPSEVMKLQKVTIRMTYDPTVPGKKEPGMEGATNIRHEGAVSKIVIETPSQTLTYPGPFDFLVLPKDNKWMVYYSWEGPEPGKPQLMSFTVELNYPPGVLSESSSVPPEGAIPARKVKTSDSGLDLLSFGHTGDPQKMWKLGGELISYKTEDD